MDPVLFIALPLLIATGASAITAMIMQARAEALAGRYAGVITGLKAALAAHEKISEERVRAASEVARRRAYDEFMSEIRVEDRHVTRGRSVVLQERVCFRMIPLTGWVEKEAFGKDEGPAQIEQRSRFRMLTSP
ncbi:MAG TPA: hypothetical protein VN428_24880 [Bryobacteraceae bacterium]|nr:hypothetical protein [Bryobacteraceae bacterium]